MQLHYRKKVLCPNSVIILPESDWRWGTATATCRRRSFLWRRISTHFDNSWIRGSWTGCNWIWWTVHCICSRNDVNFYRSSVGWRYPDLRMSTVYLHSVTSWSWRCKKMWKYVKIRENIWWTVHVMQRTLNSSMNFKYKMLSKSL